MQLKTNAAIAKEVKQNSGITLSVDCVIFGFDGTKLNVLVIESDYDKYVGLFSLLGDLVSPFDDLDAAAQKILFKRTLLKNVYLEQVKSYGNLNRHPAGRVVTIAYCALIPINSYNVKTHNNELQWVAYNQLNQMAFDHLKIAKDCLKWLQEKMLTTPIAAKLLPHYFSLRVLQNLYSAVLLEDYDKRNFRKKMQSLGYLQDTNRYEDDVTHRPGKLYFFCNTKQQIGTK